MGPRILPCGTPDTTVHVWSEDKLDKKFVVAENLAELVSKVGTADFEWIVYLKEHAVTRWK